MLLPSSADGWWLNHDDSQRLHDFGQFLFLKIGETQLFEPRDQNFQRGDRNRRGLRLEGGPRPALLLIRKILEAEKSKIPKNLTIFGIQFGFFRHFLLLLLPRKKKN